jgi:hypothetical protein
MHHDICDEVVHHQPRNDPVEHMWDLKRSRHPESRYSLTLFYSKCADDFISLMIVVKIILFNLCVKK